MTIAFSTAFRSMMSRDVDNIAMLSDLAVAQHTTGSRFRRRSSRPFRGAPTGAPLAGGGSVHGAAAAAQVLQGAGALRRY